MSGLYSCVEALEWAFNDARVERLRDAPGRWEGWEIWAVPSRSVPWAYFVGVKHGKQHLREWSCDCMHGLTGHVCSHVRVAVCASLIAQARSRYIAEAHQRELVDHECEEYVYQRLCQWIGASIEWVKARIEGGL